MTVTLWLYFAFNIATTNVLVQSTQGFFATIMNNAVLIYAPLSSLQSVNAKKPHKSAIDLQLIPVNDACHAFKVLIILGNTKRG